MSKIFFPIQGPDIVPMLGRAQVMERILGDLTKKTPSNLSLIGPRSFGKTVIMHALSKKLSEVKLPYQFVLYWHLGHVAPQSDLEFVAQLCDKLSQVLAESDEDTNDYCQYLKEQTFTDLAEVLEYLDEDGMPVLMLWDGFDKPLGQNRLTVHLWDQMRSLFYGRKHKIVIASRKPLSQLIRSQEALSSPFWNIFDPNPVKIGAFTENDQDEIISMLQDHNFQPGARKELLNWSAGIPPLFLGILNQIVEDIPRGSVDNKAINEAAEKTTDSLQVIIEGMWQDCPENTKNLYRHLLEQKEIVFEKTSKVERNSLLEMSFAKKEGNRLISCCRHLEKHIQEEMNEFGSLARLFGAWDNYKSNVRSLLQMRLSHIPRFDADLFYLVERSVMDIPNHPDYCLGDLTRIRNLALQLIWQKEFGAESNIPQAIKEYWTAPGRQNSLIDRMIRDNNWEVGSDPTQQIRLLSLLAGCQPGFESKSMYVSKDTYILINFIHSLRNRVEHSDGQPVEIGVAVAALMACIELLACLEREIGN